MALISTPNAGDPLHIKARDFRTINEILTELRNAPSNPGRGRIAGGGRPPILIQPDIDCHVGDILGLGDLMVMNQTDVLFEASTPATGDVPVIAAAPIQANTPGPAYLDGWALVTVTINDADHERATITNGDATKLSSNDDGEFQILYKAGSTGDVECLVRFGDVRTDEAVATLITTTAKKAWEVTLYIDLRHLTHSGTTELQLGKEARDETVTLTWIGTTVADVSISGFYDLGDGGFDIDAMDTGLLLQVPGDGFATDLLVMSSYPSNVPTGNTSFALKNATSGSLDNGPGTGTVGPGVRSGKVKGAAFGLLASDGDDLTIRVFDDVTETIQVEVGITVFFHRLGDRQLWAPLPAAITLNKMTAYMGNLITSGKVTIYPVYRAAVSVTPPAGWFTGYP